MALSDDEMSRLAAEWDCAKLIHRFGLLNDAGRYEELAALFAPDGVFVRPSTPDDPVQGREAILAHFRARPPVRSQHMVSNIVVTVESPTEAQAQSYLILYTAKPDPAAPKATPKADAERRLGSFADRFERIDGTWCFKARIGAMTMIG